MYGWDRLVPLVNLFCPNKKGFVSFVLKKNYLMIDQLLKTIEEKIRDD